MFKYRYSKNKQSIQCPVCYGNGLWLCTTCDGRGCKNCEPPGSGSGRGLCPVCLGYQRISIPPSRVNMEADRLTRWFF